MFDVFSSWLDRFVITNHLYFNSIKTALKILICFKKFCISEAQSREVIENSSKALHKMHIFGQKIISKSLALIQKNEIEKWPLITLV